MLMLHIHGSLGFGLYFVHLQIQAYNIITHKLACAKCKFIII